MAGHLAHVSVVGDERDVESLRQRHIRTVVSREVVAQFPDPLAQCDVWVADDRQVAEVRARIRRTLVAQLAEGRSSA